jgi:D-galactose 1-dehydrogenase
VTDPKRKIAIVGIGKIALDQHLPVIDRSDHFEVAATVSRRGVRHGDLPVYGTTAELYARHPEIELVALCTPPNVRHAHAREAIEAGKHVLLEKPPTPGIGEFNDLMEFAQSRRRVLFQTWHSQYNSAVDEAQAILASEGVKSVHIEWRESVRKWHPGQEWVWEPGGFGVFDPGINALSIMTKIMPGPVLVESAVLGIPDNRDTPIDAELTFKMPTFAQTTLSAQFDWLGGEKEVWQIRIVTGAGKNLLLDRGGTVLSLDGQIVVEAPPEEYEQIYRRFAALLDSGSSGTDGAPLVLVADAFLLGVRETRPAFEW